MSGDSADSGGQAAGRGGGLEGVHWEGTYWKWDEKSDVALVGRSIGRAKISNILREIGLIIETSQ